MKKTILILAMIAVCSIFKIQAQDKPINCDAEKWAYQPNLIIESQNIKIGAFKFITSKNSVIQVYLELIKFKDINTGITKSCLTIWYSYRNLKMSKFDYMYASIDTDEVEGIISFIKKLKTEIFITKPEIATSYSYRCRTGFSVLAKYSDYMKVNEKDFKFYNIEKCWHGEMSIPDYSKNNDYDYHHRMAGLNIEQTDFDTLLSLFEQAKEKM